jgi:hypothetical protein
METEKIRPLRLLTVAQFAVEHPAFSQLSLRHLIFDAKFNRFNSVIRRIGKRKILIDEVAFFQWVDEQQRGHHDSKR